MRIYIRQYAEDDGKRCRDADRDQHGIAECPVLTEFFLRVMPEVGHADDRHQVSRCEERTGDPDQDVERFPRLQRAESEVPLTDEADQEWRARDPQRSDGEAGHGDRELLPNAIELADVIAVRSRNDETGTHEERDLHDGMRDQVQVRALDGQRREQSRAQHDVGELPDRREGETSFQVILPHSDEGGNNDTAGSEPCQDVHDADLGEELRPENKSDDTKDSEDAGLDDSHRMKQGGNRSRRDHGCRQPAVQRHDSCLDGACHDHQDENELEHPLRSHVRGEEAARLEVDGPCDAVDGDDAGEEELTGDQCINEVFAARRERFRISLMKHQRVARKGQEFVENKEGDEVRRHGDAHDRREADREGREIAGLFFFIVASHVADGVKVHRYPEHGGERSKDHARRIRLQREPQGIGDAAEGPLVLIAIQDPRHHGKDDAKHDHGSDGAPRTFGHFLLNAIRIAAKKETPTARNGLQSMIVISETPPAVPV